MITRTISYVDQNDKELFPKVEQSVKFTRTGNVDKVTGEVVWNEWTSENSTLDEVVSPDKKGYTASRKEVPSLVVNANDSNIDEKVVYAPDRGSAIINYIDETTGKTLLTDIIDGDNDTEVAYSNKINEFLEKGYELVSNELGDSDKVVISPDEVKTYNIVFKHGKEEVTDNKTIDRTIHYVFENGKEAAPDFKYPEMTFTRTGIKDKVTGEIVWNEWSDSINSPSQKSPEIEGYTPDKIQTEDILVNADMDNISETITYKSNNEQAEIKFIDDSDDNKILGNITSEGKFGEKISFDKLDEKLKELTDAGYEIVSNNFDGQSYKAGENKFEVHLKHGQEKVTENKEITRTINFVDKDGKVLKNPVIQTLKFVKTGVKDKVAGEIVWDKVDSQKFDSIKTPEIEGYTTEQDKVDEFETNYDGENQVVNVVYTKDEQQVIVPPEKPDENKPEKPEESKPDEVKPNETKPEESKPSVSTKQDSKSELPQNNVQVKQSGNANMPKETETIIPQLGDSDEVSTALAALLGSIILGLAGFTIYKSKNEKSKDKD